MSTINVSDDVTGAVVTHFSRWAVLKSPLILGNDVTKYALHLLWVSVQRPLTFETLSITNDAIIVVNQDSTGAPANRIWKHTVTAGGDLSLLQGPLTNKRSHEQCIRRRAAPWALTDLGQKKDSKGTWGKSVETVQDWAASDEGVKDGSCMGCGEEGVMTRAG
ncbi:glycoside hydrolase family 27 protein [Ramaria rubella]|nr:glycoside hydrolase family 27 protein [Ramaria rubella]